MGLCEKRNHSKLLEKGGFKIKDDVVGDYNAADENDLADVPLPPNMDAAAFEAIVNVF